MQQLHHHQLRDIYFDQFTKIEKIHSHDTRQCKKALYFLPRVAKSIGKFQIAFRGAKLWSDIDDETKSMHWVSFKNVIVLFYLVSIKLSLEYDLSATQLRMFPLFAFTYNLSLKLFAFP